MNKNCLHLRLILMIFFALIFLSACHSNRGRSWTWYEKTYDTVYFHYDDVDDLKFTREVVGADINSFIILDDEYAKDKNAVYHGETKIALADPATFRVLGHSYSQDANNVYLNSNVIEGADPDSFEVLQNLYKGYAKDNQAAYFDVKKIGNADSKTFEYLSEFYAKDKNHVYINGQKIDGADPDSFEVMAHSFSKDKEEVYIFIDDQRMDHIPLDPTTFTLINRYYSKDKKDAYYKRLTSLKNGSLHIEMVPMNADPDTFGLHREEGYLPEYEEFAKDKNSVYYKGQIIEGFDPVMFKKADYFEAMRH